MGVLEAQERKWGCESAGPRGRERRAWRPKSEGSSEVAEARARWESPGFPRSRRGRRCDREAQDPAKPGREARGRLPGGRQAPPEGRRGSPEFRGRPPRQAEGQGGRDTHKFLGFAAVAARRGQLLRDPTLLLVPGPAAGPQAPAGRLHVLVSAGQGPSPVYATRAPLPGASNHRRRRRRPAAFLAGRRAPPH